MLVRMQRQWIFYTLLVEILKLYSHSGKVWKFPQKINKYHIRSSNQTPGHLSQRNGNYVHIKIYTKMFTVTLIVQAKNWKQFRYPSIGE